MSMLKIVMKIIMFQHNLIIMVEYSIIPYLKIIKLEEVKITFGVIKDMMIKLKGIKMKI